MLFVLKAVATLISSLKRAEFGEVDKRTWTLLISLLPYLVAATTMTAPSVASSLLQALHQFGICSSRPRLHCFT